MFDYFQSFFDFFLNLDDHLAEFVMQYGSGTYFILFAIVFVETGLVIMPFLPGDSLLFAAGAIAAITELRFIVLYFGFIGAALLGDNINYFFGRYLGQKVYDMDSRWIKRKYLDEATVFYKKYGPFAIILARFMPFVRTFAPFVAGVAKMQYIKYLIFSFLGAVGWVSIFLTLGFFFGNINWIKNNFAFVSLGIIAISILPMIYKYINKRMLKGNIV